MADLPPSLAERERVAAEKRRADTEEWRREWGYWLGGVIIMTTIWTVDSVGDGEFAFYWPVAPLSIWAAILLTAPLWSSGKRDQLESPPPDARPPEIESE